MFPTRVVPDTVGTAHASTFGVAALDRVTVGYPDSRPVTRTVS